MQPTLENLQLQIDALASDIRSLKNAVSVVTAARTAPAPLAGCFRFGKTSTSRLVGVHPDLVAVAHLAILTSFTYDFGIPATGGVRTKEQQRKLVASGRSKTMQSRHLTGHAIDIFGFTNGRATWNAEHVLGVHAQFVSAANNLNVALRWGGDWDGDGHHEYNETDLVHHELHRDFYADTDLAVTPKCQHFLEWLETNAYYIDLLYRHQPT